MPRTNTPTLKATSSTVLSSVPRQLNSWLAMLETITSTEIPVAWFANGLRIVDIARPHAPREVAHFMPPVPEGSTRVCSNDVFVDDRGLMYLVDRVRGVHILERV